jgi:hypothetical protein
VSGANRARTGDLLGAIQALLRTRNDVFAAFSVRAPGVPQHLPQHSGARSPARQRASSASCWPAIRSRRRASSRLAGQVEGVLERLITRQGDEQGSGEGVAGAERRATSDGIGLRSHESVPLGCEGTLLAQFHARDAEALPERPRGLIRLEARDRPRLVRGGQKNIGPSARLLEMAGRRCSKGRGCEVYGCPASREAFEGHTSSGSGGCLKQGESRDEQRVSSDGIGHVVGREPSARPRGGEGSNHAERNRSARRHSGVAREIRLDAAPGEDPGDELTGGVAADPSDNGCRRA